jgi:cobalt-zinc-cadmium efflux system protein
MAHSHEGHSHGGGAHSHSGGGGSQRVLVIAFVLNTAFLIVEAVGGFLTGSLALLADAGHLLSDSASLGLALFAAWVATKPPTPNRSFGYKRAEILAALINGATLVAISIWIFYEAYHRFQDPPTILAGWVLAVAVAGLVVNALGAFILSRSAEGGLNVQGATRHLLADVAGSVGAIAASVVIILTGWRYADPLISVLIGLLVIGSSWTLLRDSVNILLEQAPRGIDVNELGKQMVGVEGVEEVHDLHVWEITSGCPALSAHVLVGNTVDCHDRRRELEKVLYREFGIEHTTLQVDHVGSHEPEDQRLQFLSRIRKRDAP